ncbi:MAG: tRNA (adenosine(37)-N6)-threonylcarbamoyltransferase complex dimerization subunit type 1 TsaB [Proteobacteria bacterium]|nr:tRNA (adenosine(37)-N6)-threonylcarbamoyltransferase complex dimerization subunit type 1 TsaB [Pseudomonadota bacterium]MCP4921248.1 tRNA (adenosine(37)-N6)-threonylcarbamoyltransferase complex dimerization subunit type 1 TsaB [Pseudomonadota bacterium]
MILAIDTAGPVIGVALGDRLFQQRVVRGADAVLTPAIGELIADVELTGVAVSVGPGGFTSLRVGVAHALGIATARGVPVVPVSSLEARAALADGRVLSLLDGRKQKAYAGFYVDGVCLSGERDLPPVEAIGLAEGPFVAVGEGAVVWRELVEAAGGVVQADAARSPVAALARLAAGRLDAAIAPEAVRLSYLRDADAKLPVSR